MTTLAVYDALEALLDAEFTACPVVWENQPTPPRDANGNDQLTAWVLVEILGISDRQVSMGAQTKPTNLWQARGEILFHIHAPVGYGPRPALVIADTIATLFRGRDGAADGIAWMDMSIGGGSVATEDGKWWVTTATVEWQHY